MGQPNSFHALRGMGHWALCAPDAERLGNHAYGDRRYEGIRKSLETERLRDWRLDQSLVSSLL